ncbi:MAG: DDE-type integrase/transposase/recombinase [Nitrososphaerales archaeon]
MISLDDYMVTPCEKNPREARGLILSQIEGQVHRVKADYYSVRSQSKNWQNYFVQLKSEGWTCTCPDYSFRRVKCKHVFAVEFSKKIRNIVEVRKIEPLAVSACIFCKSSNIVKSGLRKNKYGDLQRFLCKNCGKLFSFNVGFEKMKHNPQAITSAMQLYFSGESLRNVCKSLKLLGCEVSHMSVYRWIEKYSSLMNEYLEQITPQVSDTWRADELFVKVKGNQKYLFALMDDETRFWIAQQVADNKGNSDVRPLFKNAAEYAGKKPQVVITDGARNFHQAFNKEYRTLRTTSPIHIRNITLDGQRHNNKMERMNGELRDREKVMRSLKNKDTPILKGLQIYHNFIREHEGLEGKTPAEASGIIVKGENKWQTIIENAASLNIRLPAP